MQTEAADSFLNKMLSRDKLGPAAAFLARKIRFAGSLG